MRPAVLFHGNIKTHVYKSAKLNIIIKLQNGKLSHEK